MLKRKYLLLILPIATLTVISMMVTRAREYELLIPFHDQRIMEQVIHPANIARWIEPGLTGGDTGLVRERIRISTPTTISAIYEVRKEGEKKKFLIKVRPDEEKDYQSQVSLHFKTSLLRSLTGLSETEKQMVSSIGRLKDFMENPVRFYGYDIRESTVQDSTFLFSSRTVALSQRAEAMKDMFESMIRYAHKTGAGYNNTRIFHFIRGEKDSVKLFASIAITRPDLVPEQSPFALKRMPYGKKLLVADFEGPYMEVEKAYEAMEKFKADHYYSSMAIPYHRFTDNGLSYADSTRVNLKVCYPVY